MLVREGARVYFVGYGPPLTLITSVFPEVECIDIGRHHLFRSFRCITRTVGRADAFIDLQRNSRSLMLGLLMYLRWRMPVFSYPRHSLRKMGLVFLTRLGGRKISWRRVDQYRQEAVETLVTRCFSQALSGLMPGADARPASWPAYRRPPTPVLLIAPGGSHPVKHLPPERLAALVMRLPAHLRIEMSVQLLGDDGDNALCSTLATLLDGQVSVHNLSGKLTLPELAAKLSGATALLCADSAPAHLARWIGLPHLVCMGPTAENFGYIVSDHLCQTISSRLACRPCSRHGSTTCRYGDQLCYTELDWEEATRTLVNLILARMNRETAAISLF